ncbi:MAG: hypothetical protein ABI867_11010 [Kofleriaceae bacterium]
MSKKFGETGANEAEAPTTDPFAQPGKSAPTDGLAGPADGTVPMTTGKTKVTHEATQKAPSGAAKTRTTVGVGEVVWFTADEAGTKAKWSSSAGKGKQDGANYDWTAPATPDTVTVTFDPGEGGTPTTVSMNVIGPNGIDYSEKKEDKTATGMTNKLTFLPLSVNFFGTQWRETDVEGTGVEGWFKHVAADKLKHKAAVARDIGDDNSGPRDHASFRATKPYGEDGSFKWVIPQQYSVKGANNWQEITSPFTQLTSITADGTLTVSKNGETAEKKSP